MWILSIDTALANGNIALAENGEVKHEIVLGNDVRHSSRVLEAVDGLLTEAGMALTALDGLAVTVGPGSFTGLRIGMSTVKGLAMALNKPVAGICVLETLAHQADYASGLPVMVMVDGSKQEVFTRSYRFSDGALISITDYDNPGYQAAADAVTERTVLIGNGVPLVEPFLSEDARKSVLIAPTETWLPINVTLARLAYDRFAAGQVMDGGAVTPNYIRKSDAEINLKPKTAA